MKETKNGLDVAMVGYLNTIPFVEGLKRRAYDLTLDIPANCLAYFDRGEVDIALVPVGALTDIPTEKYKIISDYCIGCEGDVRTVGIFTQHSMQDVSRIALDAHSRTSVLLTKVLCERYWKIDPVFTSMEDNQEADARLLIGDKVFLEENKYENVYDLGDAWKELTGLPFVFAVWIARPSLSEDKIAQFNADLRYGVSQIEQIKHTYEDAPHIDLNEYFTRYIKYDFGKDQQRGMRQFCAWAGIDLHG